MRRREFIAVLGTAAAWPVAARAQQDNRVRRIGWLSGGDENDPRRKSFVSAFTQALADLGWTDGRNVRIDPRWTGDDINRLPALARELVGLQPDIILASSATVTVALQRETRTIPIVFVTGVTPLQPASFRGSTAQVGTSPDSPPSNPRWEASGLSCSRRLPQGSSGPQSCSIPIRPPHRL